MINSYISANNFSCALIVTGFGVGIGGAINAGGNMETAGQLIATVAGQAFSHNYGTINLVSWVNNASIARNAYIGTSTNHALIVQVNKSGRTNSGFVGIGSTLSYILNVAGQSRINCTINEMLIITSNSTESVLQVHLEENIG